MQNLIYIDSFKRATKSNMNLESLSIGLQENESMY